MVGRIVEVYLPRVFDVFLMMSGGKPTEELAEKDLNQINKPPSDGGFSDFGHHSGPSTPDA
jgi:hypothetical protein